MPALVSYVTSARSPYVLAADIQHKMSLNIDPALSKSTPTGYTDPRPAHAAPLPSPPSSPTTSKLRVLQSPFPAHPVTILTCHACHARTEQDVVGKNRWERSCGTCGHRVELGGARCGCSVGVEGRWGLKGVGRLLRSVVECGEFRGERKLNSSFGRWPKTIPLRSWSINTPIYDRASSSVWSIHAKEKHVWNPSTWTSNIKFI